MGKICHPVLLGYGDFHPVQRHAKTWRHGLDDAAHAELPLLFQKAEQNDAYRIADIIFRFYLHRDVCRVMGPDFAGCRLLFGTESHYERTSL